MMKYEIHFAGSRVEKEFEKFLSKLSKKEEKRIYDSIAELGDNPRPPGKKFKFLEKELVFYKYVAHYRLRIGDCRVFYDVDDGKKVIILLGIERKGNL
ncbi:MAG: type II toxin-antitoxin system RelE/ParE family toxin [Firmicutes bacterium]|nr:type II toxin-antitoxin system RelE/ParE family toxin [Bacillota bacterium]